MKITSPNATLTKPVGGCRVSVCQPRGAEVYRKVEQARRSQKSRRVSEHDEGKFTAAKLRKEN